MKKRLSRDRKVVYHPGSPEQGNNLEENTGGLNVSKRKSKMKVQKLVRKE